MRGEGWEAGETCRGKMEWMTWLGDGVEWSGDWGGMLPSLTVHPTPVVKRSVFRRKEQRRCREIPASMGVGYLQKVNPHISSAF